MADLQPFTQNFTITPATHPALAHLVHWMFRREWLDQEYILACTEAEAARAEKVLATLTPEEREIFSGEADENDVLAIASRNDELRWADEWLNAIFDRWCFPHE